MDVSALKAKIKSKQIPHYMIFTGPEWKVQQIYIQQIAKVLGLEVVYLDSYSEVYSKIRSRTLTSSSKLFLLRDDTEIQSSDKITTQRIVDSLKDNFLIHILTTTDKRKKYYKENQDRIVDFEPLSDSALHKYIDKEFFLLSKENRQKLIDVCEHDYGRILLELDKLKRYTDVTWEQRDEHERDGGMYWRNECFQHLLEDGTIYQPPYDAIFDLVDAILDRKVNKAFDLLQQSYAVGEATMVMLSVLYKNAKAVLQVQSYKGNKLGEATGLTGWQIKNAKAHVRKYSDKELIHMLQMIQKVESGIKTGQIEEEIAMPYLLVSVL